MSTTEHPITRSELREELDRLRREFREHYATKADLEALRSELKEDIGTLETRLVKWIVGVQIGGLTALAAVSAAIIAAIKFLVG